MANLQTPEFYRIHRIESLRALLKSKKLDAIILFGRQNTRFYTGFSGTESIALITHKSLYIFLDSRYTTQGAMECPEYQIIPVTHSIYPLVTDYIEREGVDRLVIESQYMPLNVYLTLLRLNGGVEFHPLQDELANLRIIKDEWELVRLRKASSIADEALKALLPTIKPGQKETTIAAQLEYNMRRLGASGPAFDTICASGKRGAMPHGRASEKVVQAGEAITIDFGARFEGYCSDTTRTIFLGTPNPKMLEIYEIVQRSQALGVANLKAGMIGSEVDKISRDVIKAAGYGDYFGHGLGHSIGLEVHEAPGLRQTEMRVLPAGCMMTVEPGIYVPGLGGVRIEDTCLVKEEDCECFSMFDKSVIVIPV